MVSGSLFDEPSDFDRDEFAARLQKLAREGILIGGSSWKYEGWLDQIYTRSRYYSRGKFSKKAFEEHCLEEYVSVFPTVCGDFAFYQFPSEDFWRRLFQQAPPPFQFAFKVPEQITCRVFPAHPRYGSHRGEENSAFLDAGLFLDAFLRPLLPYQKQTALLILEFGAFSRSSFAHPAEFLDVLDPFLAHLPPEFRYCVEIRNQNFLVPDYFACLRSHGVAHVYNAWTRMPELPEQVAIPDSRTADFLVSRALLGQGVPYEKAVELYSPYTEIKEPNERTREGLREIIGIARANKKMAFLFINNRLEGNAPGTIAAITDDIL